MNQELITQLNQVLEELGLSLVCIDSEPKVFKEAVAKARSRILIQSSHMASRLFKALRPVEDAIGYL